jgi:hypothetical protein
MKQKRKSLSDLITFAQIETKGDQLEAELDKYNLFALPKLSALTNSNKQNRIKLIVIHDFTSSIAMINDTELLKTLTAKCFTADHELLKAANKWFDIAGRSLKNKWLCT